MTTSTASPLLSTGLSALTFSRHVFTRFIDNIPEDKFGFRPGGKANHALWILGHIPTTDAQFMEGLGAERSVPKEWDALFGYKSEIQDDLSKYPSVADVRAAFDGTRAALVSWFESMDDEALLKPMPEDWQTFAPTFAALMSSLAGHEALHAGQLTVIRRELGLDLLMS